MWTCSPNARIIKLTQKIVVYNSLIGGAFVLSDNVLDFFNIDEENEKIIEINDDAPQILIDTFNKHGLLKNGLSDAEIIKEKLDEHYVNIDKGNLVSNIRLTLTKSCNCRCVYCFVDKNECTPPLSFDECITFIDKIISFTQKDEYNIRFFGGEPTLEFPLIEKIVTYLISQYSEIKFSFLLNTNAQYITDEMRAFLKTHNFKTVISLDSVKEHNDIERISLINNSYYDAAIKQIQKFVDDEMQFVVGAVVTNSNVQELGTFLDTMKKIGVKSVGINHAKMVDDTVANLDKEFADKIIGAYKFGIENAMHVSGYWFLPFNRMIQGAQIGFCGGLGREFDLRPDRKVYTCVASPVSIGSISDEFISLIKNSDYQSVARRVAPNISCCNGCEIEGMCAGDCAWDAYYENKTIYSVNQKACKFQKYITRELVKYVFDDKND